ncbi:MAG: leucine-rich repeat protein, partial [Clostridia bacterium]|nr:leucine-rich repeat protein [Clostridia bacterium]
VTSPQYYKYYVGLYNPVITLRDGSVVHSTSFIWEGTQYNVSMRWDQSYENQWTGGNSYPVTGSIAGYEFSFDVIIKESPVASIEIAPLYIAENAGYWDRVQIGWDPMTGPIFGDEYYRYDVAPNDVTITLKDGTKINGNYVDWENGRFFVQYQYDQSYENQWKAGNTYQVTASLLGCETTYDVSILATQSDDTYEYMEMANGVIITDSKVTSEIIEIPSEINGKAVIGVAGLMEDSTVKELILPDSVVTIGDYLISGLNGLEKVTFGSGVKNLTASMFSHSYNLKEIVVSEENPYFESFNGELYNEEMTTVIAFPVAKSNIYNVPDTVVNTDNMNRSIYNDVQIVFSSNHPLYVTENGVTYDKDKTTILSCFKGIEGKYVMPDTVTTIKSSVFEDCDKLTEVVVSSQVSAIVYRTFASCASLEKIDLPEGLVSIEFQAFEDTPALKSIDLPETLEHIGESAFRYSGLTSLVVPDSVETIEWSAFYATDIETLDLGNGVKNIYSSAFANTPVTSVTLPDSLTFLGDSAFYNCRSLKELTIGSGLGGFLGSTFENTAIENLFIPSNIVAIYGNAFANSAISSLTLSEGVEYIGESVFYNCNNLESVHIPASVQQMYGDTFGSCDSLNTLTVAAGNVNYHSAGNCVIVTDKKLLFFGCGGSVIPDDGSVVDINEYAFYDCDGLVEIVIPDSVESIGTRAFEYCDNLYYVVIGDSVT